MGFVYSIILLNESGLFIIAFASRVHSPCTDNDGWVILLPPAPPFGPLPLPVNWGAFFIARGNKRSSSFCLYNTRARVKPWDFLFIDINRSCLDGTETDGNSSKKFWNPRHRFGQCCTQHGQPTKTGVQSKHFPHVPMKTRPTVSPSRGMRTYSLSRARSCAGVIAAS